MDNPNKSKARRLDRISRGMCAECGVNPLHGKFFCWEHQLQARERNRKRYRMKVGIPVYAPLIQRGRGTEPRLIEFRNVKRTLRDWSISLGFDHDLVERRLKRGWSTERAFTEPRNDTARTK